MSTPLTATETLSRLSSHKIRAAELLEQVLARADRLDPTLGAFVAIDREGARRAAEAADRGYARGIAAPLAGLPVTLKDLFDLRGVAPGCGVAVSPRRQPATEDAALVRRLREAGAVILGRVQMHALAFGLDGENPVLGTPENPRAPGHLPGGSSSGSAAAVAAGLGAVSIGTDTGGSVRVPAAFCGVVGFKPTFGAIDTAGAFPVAPSIDHVGLLARSVADCRLVFGVVGSSASNAVASPRTQRVGLLTDIHERADSAVREAIEGALAALPELGVERVTLPTLRRARPVYATLVLAEIAAQHEALLAAQPDNYDAAGRAMVERGLETRAVEYLRAADDRRALGHDVAALFAEHDLDALALPTVGIPAPRCGQTEVEVGGRKRAVGGILVEGTSPFSLLGLPAISIPAGLVDGRPVGLQLVARRGQDSALLALAERLEAVHGVAEAVD